MIASSEISIAEACRLIAAQAAPVLLPDTCALLDVVRAPLRGENRLIAASEQLATVGSAARKGLHVVITATVAVEWVDRLPAVEDEVAKHVKRIREALRILREACQAVGLARPRALPATLDGLPALLKGSATRLYDTAMVLADDRECQDRAYARHLRHVPPSRRGGPMKDCSIIEHYLHLCAQLRAVGFTPPCVFVSSNTNDYCFHRHHLHPNLDSDFNAVGLSFTTDLRWAKHELGL